MSGKKIFAMALVLGLLVHSVGFVQPVQAAKNHGIIHHCKNKIYKHKEAKKKAGKGGHLHGLLQHNGELLHHHNGELLHHHHGE